MSDPRETLYRKETRYLEDDQREIDEDEDIQNALTEIRKHEQEISRLKHLVNKWRKEKLDQLENKKRQDVFSRASKRKLEEFNSSNENFDLAKSGFKRADFGGESSNNTKLMKALLEEEEEKKKENPAPSRTSGGGGAVFEDQKFMLRKVHSFYSDDLFGNNRDNVLSFKTHVVNEACSFTRLNLALRYIPRDVVHSLAKKYTVISLFRLFQLVTYPDYTLPYTGEYAVIGVVHEIGPIKITQRAFFDKNSSISIDDYTAEAEAGTKSRQRDHVKHVTANVSKHFTIKLTDLKHSVTLTVHGQELIKQYHSSLKSGDLVMIDSPAVFKYSKTAGKSSGFGLSISEENGKHQIMEVGKVADYGRCDRTVHVTAKSNSDARACGMYYNSRTQKCCDYHQEKDLEKGLSRRMELNSGYLGRRITHQEKQRNLESRESPSSFASRGNRNSAIGVPDKNAVHFKNEQVASRFFNTAEDVNGGDHVVPQDPRLKERLRKEKRENFLLLKKLTDRSSTRNVGAQPAVKQSGSTQKAEEKRSNAIMLLNAAVQSKRRSKD